MKILLRKLGKHRGAFVWLLVLSSLLSAGEALLHPLMLKWIFDEAVIRQDFRRFVYLGLGYLALGLLMVALFYATSLWRKALTNRVMLDLEERLLEKSLDLDWRAFNREGVGAWVSRIHKDTQEGLAPALGLVLACAQQSLAALVFVGVLLYLSWKATLALLLVVPPLLWIAQHLGQRVRQTTAEEREGEARFLQLLTQTLQAFRLLRGLPFLRPPTLEASQAALASYLERSYQNHRFRVLQQSWNDIFMNLANTASLIVGGYYVLVRELSFGGYLAFVNTFWRAVDNTFSLLRQIPEFQRYTQILRRTEELLASVPSCYHHPAPVARLEGVRLLYSERVILDIPNLKLRPGERLLLVGPNGSGKTSLLGILSGYLAPDTGEVALPERIAALTAPVELPPLKVRELIPDPSLREALGLEEVAEHSAEALSLGQRQKAALGALLSQEADLYILDEPLANLDVSSKEKVLKLVFHRTKGRSLLMVLHGEEGLHSHFDRVHTLGTVTAGE